MRIATILVSALALLLVLPEISLAQLADADAIATQNLRGYTHMFIAYAIAWLLVIGWVISIARRLGRIENALRE